MTVRELIEELQNYDADTEVCVLLNAIDSSGREHTRAYDIEEIEEDDRVNIVVYTN